MQIKLLFRLLLCMLPVAAIGQASNLRLHSKYYEVLDRMEIKTRTAGLSQSFTKPINRKTAVSALNELYTDTSRKGDLTSVDRYNISRFLANHPRWSGLSTNGFTETGNIIKADAEKFFLLVDPVLGYQYSRESNSEKDPRIISGGFDARGVVAKKLGFDLYFTGHQERLPGYMNNWMSRYPNVPGVGRFKRGDEDKVQYFDVRGNVQTSVTRYIDLQLGYDRQFLGNGYRSLFLSDASNSAAFFKINARIWKLNLQSLYMKLEPQDGIVLKPDTRKFLRINTLGIDVTKWLNVGLFDAVVFGRKNGFDLNYIMPITFLRSMEQQSGSPDNAMLGINAKANIAGKFQLYGQLLLDEFKLDEVTSGEGWWANKFGYQFGAKYIDAFGLDNLDLQVETNSVRPFTYSHFDSISNYSHFNQPLAHPLGSNFQEYIGIVRYQPSKKLRLQGKLVYYMQGLDSAGYNSGNNVLVNYINRNNQDYGWKIGNGDKATCFFVSVYGSYEILENLFLDVSVLNRDFRSGANGNLNTLMFSAGFRWNMGKRTFDF